MLNKKEGNLLPIGTIYHEYYSVGTRASRYSHELNDIRKLKVTLEVVGHKLDELGRIGVIVKEIKNEYVD